MEEIVIRNEQLARLMPLLAELNERQRDLLALKFGAGSTNRRIVELTGLTESNVGVILYRTLHHLLPSPLSILHSRPPCPFPLPML